MTNVNVRYCDFPYNIRGFVVRKCEDDVYYTVMLNSRLSFEQQQKTYLHELEHIVQDDFSSCMSVDQIERIRHGSEGV